MVTTVMMTTVRPCLICYEQCICRVVQTVVIQVRLFLYGVQWKIGRATSSLAFF